MRKLKFLHGTVGIALIIVLFGCGGSSDDGGDNNIDPSGAPILSFDCDHTDVAYEGNVVLEWSTTNADTCTASGAWSGERGTEGQEQIGPLIGDASFTLSCSGNGQNAAQTVNVTVADATDPDAPKITLTADPTTVAANSSTLLSWSSTNADTCTASGDWSGDKAVSGEETMEGLTENSTFELQCSGVGGTVSTSATVVVTAEEVPTVTLSADPTNVAFDGSTTLSWSSSNIDTCIASGAWDGDRETSGEETMVALKETSTFELNCSGAGGTASASATVEVAPEPEGLEVELLADPVSVPVDGSTTLSWSSSNAVKCWASNAWDGDKAVRGEETIIEITEESTFTITCEDSAGASAEQSVIVTIEPAHTGTARLSWTPPTKNTDGSDLTDLKGYVIHYGRSSGNLPQKITIDDNTISSFTVDKLAPGTWYFAISAVDTSGNESDPSNEASKEIPAQ